MVRSFARSSGIAGWVKNLPDGRVEMVCEGVPRSMDKFLGKIKDEFSIYVVDVDMKPENATGEFKEFSIRF
jgi:acylphosphatase